MQRINTDFQKNFLKDRLGRSVVENAYETPYNTKDRDRIFWSLSFALFME
jgi:hypothetical protein